MDEVRDNDERREGGWPCFPIKNKSSKKPFRRIPQPCQSGPKTECSNSPDSTLPISSFSFHIQFLTDVSVNMYVLYPNNCGLLFFWREYLVIWWENIYTVWNWDQWHLAWMQFVRSFCREAKNIGVCPALPTSLDILNLFKIYSILCRKASWISYLYNS